MIRGLKMKVAVAVTCLTLTNAFALPARASHTTITTKLDMPVVVMEEDSTRLCKNVWVEDRFGTKFTNVKNLVACLNQVPGTPYIYYNWNQRARVMSLDLRVDEVTTYQLEVHPVESDGINWYEWRDSLTSPWQKFNLGRDHSYESRTGGANMMSLYDFGAALNMTIVENRVKNRMEVYPKRPALLNDYDRVQLRDNYFRNTGEGWIRVNKPAGGIWAISPMAMVQGERFGKNVFRIQDKLNAAGLDTMIDVYGLRIRVFEPTGLDDAVVNSDIYPADLTTVMWFYTENDANKWKDNVAAHAGIYGGGGGVVGITTTIAAHLLGASTTAGFSALLSVASSLYTIDRAFELKSIGDCISDAKDFGGSFSMGLVVDSQSPTTSHSFGCVPHYTWMPVNARGSHY